MSFLLQKNLTPHLLLHVLDKSANKESSQIILQRLNLLARTRRFQEIAKTSAQVQNMKFPTLASKLQSANKESQERKQTLGLSNVFTKLKELDDLSKEQDPNFELIDSEHSKIYELSKILFEEGNYIESLKILVQLQKQELKEELWLRSTWARLYCEILLQKDEANRTLDSLKKKIDDIETEQLAFHSKSKKNTSVLMKKLYAQREQFLILALFVIFRKGNDQQLQRWVDYCTTEKGFFSILQLTCPELLRYVIAALIMNKTLQNNKDNRTFDLFKLVQVLNRKIVKYTDALSQFVFLLEIQYDFEAAKTKIQECRVLIKEDIFLRNFQTKLIEGLNFIYFKQACKVYETFPLSEVAAFTGLGSEEAELWILGYIRSGDIDAKIDSISECVVSNKGRHHSLQKYVDIIPALGAFVSGLSRSVTTH